jgi:hypothetical protein
LPLPKRLLSIIELGGYPNFRSLYESLGFEVSVETRMRKALAGIRKQRPDVIVAEFNFQSDFRDRSSSLESMLAVVQQQPDIRVIIFYDEEYRVPLDRLRDRLPVYRALPFPVVEQELRAALQDLSSGQVRTAPADAAVDK